MPLSVYRTGYAGPALLVRLKPCLQGVLSACHMKLLLLPPLPRRLPPHMSQQKW